MSSRYKGSRKVITALDSYIKLTRATETINSKIYRVLKKSGFTESQFKILDALYHLGALTQKSLGEKLLSSGGNITMVIDNLEKRALVKRKRGIDDRRLFYVQITDKGKTEIEHVMPAVAELISREMNILSKQEQIELQSLCKKIGLKQK
jgi:MarR family transcriptional regulator, 2-MHQ and catechol-resistance regulon repressor